MHCHSARMNGDVSLLDPDIQERFLRTRFLRQAAEAVRGRTGDALPVVRELFELLRTTRVARLWSQAGGLLREALDTPLGVDVEAWSVDALAGGTPVWRLRELGAAPGVRAASLALLTGASSRARV